MNDYLSYYYFDERHTPAEKVEIISDGQPEGASVQQEFQRLLALLSTPNNDFPAREIVITDSNVAGIPSLPYTMVNTGFNEANLIKQTTDFSAVPMVQSYVEDNTPTNAPITRHFTIQGCNTADHWIQLQRRQGRWLPCVPTGIFVRPNEQIRINVSRQDADFCCYIGTFGFSPGRGNNLFTPVRRNLNQGDNIVTDAIGGLLYFGNDHAEGTSITVNVTSGGVWAPLFKLGTHHATDWRHMLNQTNPSTLMELQGRRVLLTVTRSSALNLMNNIDPTGLLQRIDESIDIQDQVSGIASNLPDPHRPDPHLLHMFEAPNASSWMFMWTWGTGYSTPSLGNVIVENNFVRNGWGPWHEQGHTRQMTPWLWRGVDGGAGVGEVTVNIYSLYTQRAFGNPSRLELDGVYPRAFTYLNQSNRNYHALTDVWIKLVMFWQLDLGFGRNFYPKLHRICREMVIVNPATVHDRQQFFVYLACLTANRNLAPFFQRWGYEIDRSLLDIISVLPPLQQPIWNGRDIAPVVEHLIPDNFQLPLIPTTPLPPLDVNNQQVIITSALNDSATLDASSATVMSFQTRNNSNNQTWQMMHNASDNTFFIRNVGRHVFLQESGTTTVLTANASSATRWRLVFIPGSGRVFEIQSSSGRLLDAPGSNTSNGTRPVTHARNGGTNQRFAFHIIGQTSPSIFPPIGPAVPEVPEPQPPGTGERFMIATALNGTSVIEPNGGNIRLWTQRNDNSQVWEVNFDTATRTSTIRNVTDGRFLSEMNNAATLTNQVTNAARWRIISSNPNNVEIQNVASNRFLDVRGSSTANGTDIITWGRSNNMNQRFVLQPESSTMPPPTLPTTGSIRLNVTNASLPFTPVITVNGTNYNVEAGSFQTIENVMPGTHPISTHTITVGNTVHTPTISPNPAQVTAGQTTNVNICYNISINPTLPQPTSGLTWSAPQEGQARQTITIRNTTGSSIPSNAPLRLTYTGTNPQVEWPALWAQGSGGVLNSRLGTALANNGTFSFPVAGATNTRITGVTVNNIDAIRQ